MAEHAFAAETACHARVDFDTALARMVDVAATLGSERVALAEAAGRVLAQPIIAQRDAPPVDVAAMDGYAIRTSTADGAATFQVVGESFPGAPCAAVVKHGTAIRVFTGAPIPSGADRVIVQEHVTRYGDRIVARTETSGRDHIRKRGSDFVAGDILLPTGRLLDPRAMVAAAASGTTYVTVSRRPRVIVLASGDELSRPGEAPGLACGIPDSVSLAVAALAIEWGANIAGMTIAPDRFDLIDGLLGTAMETADIVVIVGGASVGDRDFSRAVARSQGAAQTFAQVAMKPGKPVWHGTTSGKQVLGLPGNPTAALTTARLFLAPLICCLTGRGSAVALRAAPRRSPTPRSLVVNLRPSCAVLGMASGCA